MRPTPIEDAEGFLEISAKREGLRVIGRDRDGGRDVDVTLKDGDTCFEVRFRPRRNGYVAGVFHRGDHTLNGMPHRTGPKGVLEPVASRIVEVDRDIHADNLKFGDLIGAEIARAISQPENAAPIQQAQADRIAERIVDIVTAEPESARIALTEALGEMFDPDTLARLFDAVDRHLDALPSPRFG